MLALYHMPGAVCAQKVRTCLAEKGLSFDSHLLTPPDLRTPDYLKMNPGGFVPTLVHDDRILTESRVICEYLNEAFPGPALMPEDPYERAKVSLWTKQIDDGLHLNVYTLTCALIFRHIFNQMSPEQQDVALPLDLTKRERTRDIMANGVQSHYAAAAMQRFAKLMADMERALQQSQWLACDRYSLADIDYTPYLQRLGDLGVSGLWADKPAVQDWWARVQARPSFRAVQADWMGAEDLARASAASDKGAAELMPLLKAA
jgi:glutathione S-transferase